jgi:hypothetical protein
MASPLHWAYFAAQAFVAMGLAVAARAALIGDMPLSAGAFMAMLGCGTLAPIALIYRRVAIDSDH